MGERHLEISFINGNLTNWSCTTLAQSGTFSWAMEAGNTEIWSTKLWLAPTAYCDKQLHFIWHNNFYLSLFYA